MIKSFKHKGLKKFYLTGKTTGVQAIHVNKLRQILTTLEHAAWIEDIDAPAFRLHALKGRRNNFWSVWVSGNWRVTFTFTNGEAEIVDYEDYH